jgi:uncharacterized protein YndB with AHSA1/START domain
MDTEAPQIVISRVFDAPRALVYRAFTDPDHLAAWWGPIGNALPRDEIEFDVRQWLPGHLAGPSERGWIEAFTKLEAALAGARTVGVEG